MINLQNFISENQPVLETWTHLLHIKTDDQIDQLVEQYEVLMTKIQAGEEHLRGLADTIKTAILKYESKFEFEKLPADELLKSFMQDHNHTQKYLEDQGIASRTVISDVLNKKRKLNAGQIERLSKLYHVSPAVFIPEI